MKHQQIVRLFLTLTLMAPLAAHASYFSEVMADNPLVYYRLGESSAGTATDSSGNGYHGTYNGGNFNFSQAGAIYYDPNTAVRFAGNLGPARVDSPVTTFNPTAAWTISLWIKPEAVGETKGIVAQKDGSGTGRSLIYQSYDGINDNSYFATFLGGTERGWGGGFINPTYVGSYLHLALVYNGSGGLQWYTNGIAAASYTGVSAEAANGAFVIGSLKDNTGPLRGTLDEVAIFQSALSAADILGQYQSAFVAPEPSTLLLLAAGGGLLWRQRRKFTRT